MNFATRLLCLVVALASLIPRSLIAQVLPAHCENAAYRDQLRSIGPVVSVGASTSSGLLAKSFPVVAAHQLCLSHGAGLQYLHTVSSASKFPFLKKVFKENRPRIVIALDHLHHSSKRRRFDAETRQYLDAEIAMLTLDCNHPLIDCSPGGEFHFVKTENYRPIVLLGDIHAFYAEDCTQVDAFANAQQGDRNVGCLQDYNRMNIYLSQRAASTPNLFIFSVDSFYKNLHRGLPFIYDVNGQLGNFYAGTIFWDGWHPWSEPGVQMFANLVLDKLNDFIVQGKLSSDVKAPYIAIHERYFQPFTGIVLINDSKTNMGPATNVRLVSEKHEPLLLSFSEKRKFPRGPNEDWAVLEKFDRASKTMIERVGTNPLVLMVNSVTEDGRVILSDEQRRLLEKISADSRHQLLGGVITSARQ